MTRADKLRIEAWIPEGWAPEGWAPEVQVAGDGGRAAPRANGEREPEDTPRDGWLAALRGRLEAAGVEVDARALGRPEEGWGAGTRWTLALRRAAFARPAQAEAVGEALFDALVTLTEGGLAGEEGHARDPDVDDGALHLPFWDALGADPDADLDEADAPSVRAWLGGRPVSLGAAIRWALDRAAEAGVVFAPGEALEALLTDDVLARSASERDPDTTVPGPGAGAHRSGRVPRWMRAWCAAPRRVGAHAGTAHTTAAHTTGAHATGAHTTATQTWATQTWATRTTAAQTWAARGTAARTTAARATGDGLWPTVRDVRWKAWVE